MEKIDELTRSSSELQISKQSNAIFKHRYSDTPNVFYSRISEKNNASERSLDLTDLPYTEHNKKSSILYKCTTKESTRNTQLLEST
jgi:hypothetical protein